jgi:hypothetical protein
MMNCEQDDRKGPRLLKSDPGKSATKKTMRVATVFCGTAAATAAFGPTAMANTKVPAPYRLTVYTNGYVYKEQVCGYRDYGGVKWSCSSVRVNPRFNAPAGSVSWGRQERPLPGPSRQNRRPGTCEVDGRSRATTTSGWSAPQ